MLTTPAPTGTRLLSAVDEPAPDDDHDQDQDGDQDDVVLEAEAGEGEAGDRDTGAERFLVRFMSERDPALVAEFVRLRVIDPERRDWRRGYPAARRWHAGHGGLRVPLEAIDYDAETGTSHPVGAWLGEQRRAWSVGSISRRRVGMLDALGMVWNTEDAAFEDGPAMCRAYFAVHGHLAAPKSAAVDNYPVGQFLANCRRPLDTRRNPDRWARLAEIDADWNPAGRADPAERWSVEWQRMLAVVRLHVKDGGSLDALVPGYAAGGEDVGAWLDRQRRGAADLTPAQREVLAGVGVEVVAVPEQRAVVVDRWVLTLAAAAGFREQEGHLVVPRKHVEPVEVGGVVHAVKLDVALANARQRQATWPVDRVDALTVLGMRWV